jgi:hypothetical protein
VSIDLPDLTTLDPTLVQSGLAEASTLTQELHPDLDLKRGPVYDLVTYPSAVLASAWRAALTNYLAARSLLDVQANPAVADTAAVDALLSNFRITRATATAASGSVAVVVSQPTTVTMPSGTTFTAGSQTFTTFTTITAKSEPEQVVGPGDRLLSPLPNGSYRFTVAVVATVAGAAGNVRKDTAFTPLSPPAAYVSAAAASDFTGGADAETNSDLLSRLLQGVAAVAPSNRTNMAAMLRAQPQFAGYVALSIVGYGDPEMLRDKHTLLPLATGGRVDWYVRTAGPAYRTGLTVTATLVSIGLDGYGVWQFALGRDDAPGFYEVRNIQPVTANPATTTGGYPLVSDTRTIDLSPGVYIPDVKGLVEGAYSRYQAAVLRFRDTSAPASLSIGATAQYNVEAVGMPLIAGLQDFLSGRDVRSYGCDVLIRAPVPCFTAVAVVVNRRATDPDPDVAGLQSALAGVVNTGGFTGRLFAGALATAAAPYLKGAAISSVDMLGRFRYPDGTEKYLRANDALVVPDVPGSCVSARTVQFFLDPQDVIVSVVNTIPSP